MGDEGAKRDIWVLGFRESDERPDSALARVFSLDSLRARRLVASLPAVVKREVSPEAAEPIVQALRKIGARVALVPCGASKPPTRSLSMPPAPEVPKGAPVPADAPSPAASGGLGDVAAREIDFGEPPQAAPSPRPAAAPRSPAPPSPQSPATAVAPRSAPAAAPRSPAPAAEAPPAALAPPPLTFLDPVAVPEPPETPPAVQKRTPILAGAALVVAGLVGLTFALGLEGNVLGGEQPTLVAAGAVAGALAFTLYGLQLLVGALLFDVRVVDGVAIAVALALGGGVAATGYALHHEDPAELARRQRAETMAAIREGRLPEARTYLREPGRAFRGMDRGASVALVDRLYEAGARQVYVGVDFAEAPEEAHGLAISMPLTATRRRAVEAALRAQVPAPPAGQEWWLVELE
ncbi:MAG: hypothetical protein CMN30_13835 [Sandaracinus sp.]|nr:hypothetical protein [Sandaracinus sp.]